jgi:DNA-binding CsgD family transcriptional regulator
MNELPMNLPLPEWIDRIRMVLASEFPDIDRISICLNINCPLESPEGYEPRLHISEHPFEVSEDVTAITVNTLEKSPSEYHLAEFRRLGMPLDDLHPPVIIEYRYRGMAYLGTTFLWRKREEGEISPESIALFRSLEPFLTMVYTYAVLCNRISHPIEVNIHRELEDISAKYGLSIQEQRVITARILGLSLKETANALNIREDSTKKLAQKAYRKCGCTNHVDFVAQFITPRMFPSAKPPQS